MSRLQLNKLENIELSCNATLAPVHYVSMLTINYFPILQRFVILMQYLLKQAFGLHEVIPQTNVENELKEEHQSEEQNQETTFIKYPNLEEDTLDKIKPTNDIEEQERFTVSHVGEKL